MKQLNRQGLRSHTIRLITLLALPLLLAACGTPAVVSVRNITDATSIPATTVALLPLPTQGDMADMPLPTNAPQVLIHRQPRIRTMC